MEEAQKKVEERRLRRQKKIFFFWYSLSSSQNCVIFCIYVAYHKIQAASSNDIKLCDEFLFGKSGHCCSHHLHAKFVPMKHLKSLAAPFMVQYKMTKLFSLYFTFFIYFYTLYLFTWYNRRTLPKSDSVTRIHT